MANAQIAAHVTRETVGAALRQARIDCAQHLRWLNALNRAALNLEACAWAFDGETLIIHSATSGTRYHVTARSCECAAFGAGRPCWHRAACRLLEKAAELAYTAGSTNGYQDAPAHPFADERPTFAELQRAADALYG